MQQKIFSIPLNYSMYLSTVDNAHFIETFVTSCLLWPMGKLELLVCPWVVRLFTIARVWCTLRHLSTWKMCSIFYDFNILFFSQKFSYPMTRLLSMFALIWALSTFLFPLLRTNKCQCWIFLTWNSTKHVKLFLMRIGLFALFLKWHLHNSLSTSKF